MADTKHDSEKLVRHFPGSREDRVLAERVDYFTMNDGRKVVLPVNGVFEVRDGKITRFSDYFDLADFEKQSGFKL